MATSSGGQAARRISPPGDHQPRCGAQRLRQDHPHEPVCRADPPTAAAKSVLGHLARDRPAKQLCRMVGYCAQFDAFPKGLTGYQFIYSFLLMSRHDLPAECDRADPRSARAGGPDRCRPPPRGGLQQGHAPARQAGPGDRARSQGASCSTSRSTASTRMARAETIALFRQWGDKGRHVHRLQPHSARSGPHLRPGDPAQPGLRGGRRPDPGRAQRGEGAAHADPGALRPARRCWPRASSSRTTWWRPRSHADGKGLLLRTRDADSFYLLLNRVILESGLEVESVAPADDDVNSVYQYLIGAEGAAQ